MEGQRPIWEPPSFWYPAIMSGPSGVLSSVFRVTNQNVLISAHDSDRGGNTAPYTTRFRAVFFIFTVIQVYRLLPWRFR